MKKRNLFLLLLSLVCVVCMAFGFVACGEEDTKPQYTITFSLGEYTGTQSAPASLTKDANTEIALPEVGVTWENHSFLGWKEGTDGDLLAAGSSYTITKNATLTAQWQDNTPTEYTITFALGEYTGEESAPKEKTESANAQITLPDLDFTWDASHVFIGWKEGTNGDLLAAGSSYTVTKNATLTAQWRYRGKSVGSQILGWFTEGTLQTAIDDGETVILEVTFGGAALAWHGLWLDVNANDDWYRFRVDSAVETNNGGNSWTNTTHTSMQYVNIDRSAWNEAAYLALFAENGKALQVATASLKDNVLSYTVTAYAADDLKLATPIVSSTYMLTSTADINSLTLAFYHDKGITLDDGYLLAPQDPYEYVTFTFDYDYDDKEDVYNNIIVGKPYTFGTDPDRGGYTFKGWQTEGDPTLYKQGDTYPNVTTSLTFTAQWEADTPSSNWVEFTGEVDVDPYGSYARFGLTAIVWVKMDVNGEDLTVKYKVKGKDTEYEAQADAENNNETYGLYYILSDFGSKPREPRVYLKVSADHDTLTIYTSDGTECGTLTIGGGADPGPVDPPPTGDRKLISFSHAANAPDGVPNDFPNLTSGEVGTTVTIPEIKYSIPHYTFNGWNVYKLVGGDWTSDEAFSRIANGGSFTMPNYAIKLVSNFSLNYVTIKFNGNGGSGEMADITGTYRYNSTISITGTKFQNKFTKADGATWQYWSVTADGSKEVTNGYRLTEENGVTADDILTLYAIWDTTSVTPGPEPEEQDIADFVGKWETELVSGNHEIIIIAKSGEYGVVGYAVLDGKTFITIFELNGALSAHNTDAEFISIYTFALSEDGDFTLTIFDIDDHYEAAYTFTKKENVPTASEDTFHGKWTRNASQRVLIEANGVAYYSYQGIKTVNWLLVGEYLVFSYTASNDYDYYYILTKTGDALEGFFLAPDVNPAAVTLSANGFYTLKVDGELVQFVNEGGKPEARPEPTAPSGKKFGGWVLADSDTPFSFDVIMTADASIIAKFVDDSGSEEPPAPTEGEYTGDKIVLKNKLGGTLATVTSASFNDTFTSVKFYLDGGTTKDVTLKDITNDSDTPSDYPNASKGASVYEFDLGSFDFIISFDAAKHVAKFYSVDDELLGTLTKAGASTDPVEPETNKTYTGNATWTVKGLGAAEYVITKIVVDMDSLTVKEVTYSVNGTGSTASDKKLTKYTYIDGHKDDAYKFTLTASIEMAIVISADGNSLLLYETVNDSLVGTFTKV